MFLSNHEKSWCILSTLAKLTIENWRYVVQVPACRTDRLSIRFDSETNDS